MTKHMYYIHMYMMVGISYQHVARTMCKSVPIYSTCPRGEMMGEAICTLKMRTIASDIFMSHFISIRAALKGAPAHGSKNRMWILRWCSVVYWTRKFEQQFDLITIYNIPFKSRACSMCARSTDDSSEEHIIIYTRHDFGI